ncbi:beta-mannosidase [Klebsiella pneumoniae]|uniref:Beta-mannosidase n=1 Tax=Klebsiella pneumoniae TaxID=573 RepID=A0A377TVV1_KLEPN|nr:beta-mannosidase [Klebsiella pneumoniae]
MLHRRLLLLVVCLPLAHAGSAPVTWSLAGQWRVHDANDSAFDGAQASDGDWRTLRVPANWYSAGYDHQGALWYRHQFTLHGLSPDAMATLVFDGVDYFAEVALNGKTLARHEGYFQRFPVDISGAIRRHNQLAVRVDSPYEDPQKIWPLHKTLMKGILNQHDTRPGGAWSVQGQDANSGGIWAPVRLHLSRGVTHRRGDPAPGLATGAGAAHAACRNPLSGCDARPRHATPDGYPGQFFRPTFSPGLRGHSGENRRRPARLAAHAVREALVARGRRQAEPLPGARHPNG